MRPAHAMGAIDLQVVLFVYGLAFFAMGVAVSARLWPLRDEPLAAAFSFLALFGLAHAGAEWLELWALARGKAPSLEALGAVAVAASFLFLACFGLSLGLLGRERRVARRALGATLAGGALGIAAALAAEAPLALNVSSRWVVGMPGGLAAAWFLTRRHTRWDGPAAPPPWPVRGLALVLAVYGSTVVIGPVAEFFPASVLNKPAFFAATGVRMEAVRSLLALLISVMAVLTLGRFDVLDRRRLSAAVDRATAALERSRASLRAVLDTAPIAIGVLDGEGRVLRANPALAAVLGLGEPREVEGRVLWEFLAPMDLEVVRGAVTQPKATPVEGRVQRADGVSVDLEWIAAKQDWEGAPATVVLARDVTEHKQLLVKAIQWDRLAAVGGLAAGVGHEINNPLTYVMGNLEYVQKKVSDLSRPAHVDDAVRAAKLAEVAELLGETQGGAERIRDIVRDLRTFSRAEAPKDGVVEPHRAIEAAVGMAWNEIRHRARLVKQLGPAPKVGLDETRLGQVVLNLLINAAQAMPDGRDPERNEIRVTSATDAEGNAVIEVHDTGRGIAPDVLPKIFDPFFTTKPVGRGTGLGLSVSRNIVVGAGGELSVQSQPGVGSTFRVTLPPARTPSTEVPRVEAPLRVATRRARVLVVDDELPVLRALRRSLETQHEVVAVDSGNEALEVLQRETFDLIVCDVMMPGVSGLDVYERLKERSPRDARRLVFLSGGAFSVQAQERLSKLPNPQLEKPVDTSRLLQLVQQAVA